MNYLNEIADAEEEIKKHIVIKTFKARKANGDFTGRFGPRSVDKKPRLKNNRLFETENK